MNIDKEFYIVAHSGPKELRGVSIYLKAKAGPFTFSTICLETNDVKETLIGLAQQALAVALMTEDTPKEAETVAVDKPLRGYEMNYTEQLDAEYQQTEGYHAVMRLLHVAQIRDDLKEVILKGMRTAHIMGIAKGMEIATNDAIRIYTDKTILKVTQ